jgi:hypothetical protein
MSASAAKIHRCELCDYGTPFASNMSKHLSSKKHLNNEKEARGEKIEKKEAKSYSCNWCECDDKSYITTDRANFKRHLDSVHEEEQNMSERAKEIVKFGRRKRAEKRRKEKEEEERLAAEKEKAEQLAAEYARAQGLEPPRSRADLCNESVKQYRTEIRAKGNKYRGQKPE